MQPDTHSQIDCPVCARPLVPVAIGQVTVDVCHQGCGGIWFDHFELQKFDEPHELGGKLLEEVEKNPGFRRDPAQRLRCPRCKDVVMRQHFFSVKQNVQVDSCPGCGGYWLDHGELKLIRSEFASARARELATEKFLEDLDDRNVSKPCPERFAKSERAQSLSAMFTLVGSRYV